LNANGSFVYTPFANFSGADSFTYKANDGKVDSNTASVSVTVNAVNDAPVAQNDSYSAQENTVLSVTTVQGVLANDSDADSPALTAAVVAGPSHGTLVLNLDGSFTYTPAINYVGSDSFTYRANDGFLNSNTATVSITIGGGLPDYGFNGFLAPWTENPIYTANKGNSVPLSWQYLNPANGRPADTSTLLPEMRFSKTANADCTGAESAPIINRDNPGNTSFMYINTKQQPQTWQFNWKTDDPVFTTGCWMARVYLSATGQLDRPAGFKIILK
jgi:VCBS repeat-containing protein